jgi:sugar (pentulose or hexulose) kinase
MLSGGGAKSDVWAAIEADVLGKTVTVPVGVEFGAKGAVLTAMVAMGLFSDHKSAIKQLIKAERVFEPNAGNHALYRDFFELYRSIVGHLWTDWDTRSEVLKKAAAMS